MSFQCDEGPNFSTVCIGYFLCHFLFQKAKLGVSGSSLSLCDICETQRVYV